MVKQRNKENSPYPKNWRMRKRGERGDYVISYRVPKAVRHLWDDQAEFELGRAKTLPQAEKAAYREWERRIITSDSPLTMQELFDRYEAEVIPKKSPATQKSNHYSLQRLRSVIPAKLPINQFRTHHAYKYRDACAQHQSPKKANLDLEVLSHCFTKAFEWGCDIIEHPIKGKVNKVSILPRDRYVEDWEVNVFTKACNAMLKVYLPLKLATGKDKSMILRIRLQDIKEDGLLFEKRQKIKGNAKAKKSLMPFKDHEGNSTGLEEILNEIKAWRKKHLKIGSVWLFCTTQGQPYIKEDGNTSGFDSQWQRAMQKALKDTKLQVKFTEHDLCAKTASDVETLEQAANMRGHLNKTTTDKVYRRKPNIVLPLTKKERKQ